MEKITKFLAIPTAILGLVTVVLGWNNDKKLNDLNDKQEKRDSINFLNECKFKVFDYVSKSFEKDEKNQKATIILVQNIIEDSIFKANLINSILGNIDDKKLKLEIEKTLTANDYEDKAFEYLFKKDIVIAKVNFEKSYKNFETLHNVKEINELLKNYSTSNLINNENWMALYKEIYPKYQWGMSSNVKNEFIIKTKNP